MPSSGMFRRMALVRTEVWDESTASIMRVARIGELGTTLAITNNRSTQRINSIHYKNFVACVGC
jgi:hypothetical protein